MNQKSPLAATVTIISVIAAVVIFGLVGLSLLGFLIFSSMGTPSKQAFVEIAEDLDAASSDARETTSTDLIQKLTDEEVTFEITQTQYSGTSDGTGIVIIDGNAVGSEKTTSWRVITGDDSSHVWGYRLGENVQINTGDEALAKNLKKLLETP